MFSILCYSPNLVILLSKDFVLQSQLYSQNDIANFAALKYRCPGTRVHRSVTLKAAKNNAAINS